MRYLLIVLMLSGCSAEVMRGIGSGLQTAGGTLSPDVYNTQHGLPPQQQQQIQYQSTPPKRIDQVCMQRCFQGGYQWAFCENQCWY